MAANDVGEVLFARGQDDEEDEDIWDDTALIKAYDEAVSMVKLKVAEQNGTPLSEQEISSVGKVKKKKKKAKKSSRRQWAVGDRCRARFTEDNRVYEAQIISLDGAAGTCYVRYVDYGNEEEQNLCDLMTVKKARQKIVQPVQSQSDFETDSGMEYMNGKASPVGHRSRASTNPSVTKPGLPAWGGPARDPHMAGFVPPMFPGMMGMNPPPPTSWNDSQRMPFNLMPPPPPPPPLPDMNDTDNEALCSMLMSWYMSGYHTGYYMGIQQGRKQSGCSSPFVNR